MPKESPEKRKKIARSLLDCLVDISRIHQNPQTLESLTGGLPITDNKLTIDLFQRAAERANLDSTLVDMRIKKINVLQLPAILISKKGEGILLLEITSDKTARIQFDNNQIETISLHDLKAEYSGKMILIESKVQKEETADTTSSTKRTKFGWVWNVMKKYLPVYGEVLLASGFINLLALAVPLFVMNVYDRVVPNNAIETLWVLAIGVFIAFSFDFLMRTLRTRFVDNAAQDINAKLSAKTFEQLLGLRMSVRPESTGSLTNTVQAFQAFLEFITSATISALMDFPFILIYILVIALIGGSLFWIPLLLVPIVLGTSFALQKPLYGLVQKSYELASMKQSTLLESLLGISSIKVNNAQSDVQRRWESIVVFAESIDRKLRRLSSFIINFSIFMQYFGSILIVIAGVYKITNGDLSIGGLIACTILTGRVLAPLVQMSGLLIRYQQSLTGLKGLNELMQLPVDNPIGHPYIKPEKPDQDIEFRNVSFTYPMSAIPALDNVSFTIKAGEKVAIIGRVGSGKTTLQKLILSFYQASLGNVLINDIDITQLDPNDIRQSIGYVPQDITLFSGTIKDNITLGAHDIPDEMILEAARVSRISDLISYNPDGIHMQVGERGQLLSGGQKQAVIIAQALLRKPKLLIFDEPTTAMDSATEAQFIKAFSENLSDKTLLLVTNKRSMLALINRIIIIDSGKIIADGTREDVLQAIKDGRIKPRG